MTSPILSLLRVTLMFAALAALVAPTSGQVVLLSNLPSNDGSFTVISGEIAIGGISQKAVSFAMPATSYNVNSVTLRLKSYPSSASSSFTPVIGIYSDLAGVPGTLVGNVAHSSGTFSATTAADFSFTTGTTLTLASNTTYWLLVDASVPTSFYWMRSSPNVTPTGVASYGGYINSGDDGVTYAANATSFSSFAIYATAIPEPSTCAALFGRAALGFAAYRHRNRT
jgi:hypothetical protein